MSANRRAVFLDRDGVLNAATVRDGKPYPPKGLDDLVVLEEAREGCRLLREAGFVLVCVTNQPDIARGAAALSTIQAINDILKSELHLDAVSVCPHDDSDECGCRKPAPGLLVNAAAEMDLDLRSSFMVGDRWRDIEAGQAAGCRVVFIDRGYSEKRPSAFDFKTDSMRSACAWIISQS